MTNLYEHCNRTSGLRNVGNRLTTGQSSVLQEPCD